MLERERGRRKKKNASDLEKIKEETRKIWENPLHQPMACWFWCSAEKGFEREKKEERKER